jgi:tRNA-2-methylthio-N6-dimethylallyladenosine synthase
VGFPNEDQRAFGNTVRLMEDLKFDMAYISKYSPRAGTNSFVMKNNVAESEKIERQKILTKILELSALERNKEMEGGNEVVIVQEKKRGFLFGKTKKYKTVKFKGPESMIGSFVKVKIKKALPWRLEAEISQK